MFDPCGWKDIFHKKNLPNVPVFIAHTLVRSNGVSEIYRLKTSTVSPLLSGSHLSTS